MSAQTHQHPQHQHQDEEVDLDWEEFDGNSPFWIHCVAGSFAGVMEHCATYPLDTVRTHIQVCAACVQRGKLTHPGNHIMAQNSKSAALLRSAIKTGAATTTASNTSNLPLGMWQTIRYLVNEPVMASPSTATATATSTNAVASANPATATATAKQLSPQQLIQGYTRLWRGVQTILVGCIPAHALYFSSYELVKHANTDADGNLSALGSSLAGAAATFGHDCIMTPLDTIKQRMQLGHYNGVVQAFQAITANESHMALYRSFPVTLATNIPYGMLMVTTHETCKTAWKADPDKPADFYTVLAASSMAGFVASALTTPLDRIKTALQTQRLAPAKCKVIVGAGGEGAGKCKALIYSNWRQAAKYIYTHEGASGFFRGMTPRVMSHTPAVAISWTTYETTRDYLTKTYAS